MRKISFIIITLLGLLIVGVSCNKTPTYIDRLNDEQKAIDKFISEKNIKVLKEYPADSTFASNEFYRDPTSGVYYNVVDKGGRKPAFGEEVYVRYKNVRYLTGTDTTTYAGNFTSILGPETLVYGNVKTYVSSGWVVPLGNVGHLGRVKMIVPFNSGTAYDLSNYATVYYDLIEYRVEEPYVP